MSNFGNLAAVATSEGFTATREATAQSARRLSHFFQPWHRRVLVVIALVAAFCDFFQLQRNGYANLYYAAAVRSMLESWHNFFFVSFDPGGFVTVDKPPRVGSQFARTLSH